MELCHIAEVKVCVSSVCHGTVVFTADDDMLNSLSENNLMDNSCLRQAGRQAQESSQYCNVNIRG